MKTGCRKTIRLFSGVSCGKRPGGLAVCGSCHASDLMENTSRGDVSPRGSKDAPFWLMDFGSSCQRLK